GRYVPELLPLPHHQMVIQHVVDRILIVQDFLKQRILLENVSRYLEFKDSHIPEWEFLSEITKRADCDILLDVNNLYVNAYNHQFCPKKYMAALPKERVRQFHLAGHQDKFTHLLDTHDQAVSPAVWDCFAKALAMFGEIPALIEWDTQIPSFSTLLSESQKIGAYY
ncbi:MAG TPA: DUF692 domain-containing protein, partial [Candidatus Berkiella sp.]|nr:DUF692 domain-containing protein [Candidatus Berkiella sp.]